MRKIFILTGLILLLSACTDELYQPLEDEISSPEFVSEWEAGRRLFVFDPWEKPIIIGIKKTFTPDMKAVGSRLTGSLKKGELLNYLHFTVSDTTAVEPFMVRIPINAGTRNAGNDTLYLVCRPTAAKEVDIKPYEDLIGRTINVTGSVFDTPKNQMLVASLLYKQLDISTDVNGSFGYGRTGMKYEEMEKSMWEDLGISGCFSKSLKKTNLLFSGSMTQHYETSSFRSNKYEFHYDTHVRSIIRLKVKNYIATGDPDVFLPYISDEAVRLLNDSSDPLYKKYANDKEGITELYNDYGTHILVGGLFGGRYTYLYGRKENYYIESVANSATAELSGKASSGAVEGENWLQTYYRVMGDHKGTLSGAGGDTNSAASEHMDEHSIFIVSGGNASYDMDSWLESITGTDSNLALISLCNLDAMGNTAVDGASDIFAIPLYRIAKDEERIKAMETYLEEYIESKYVAPEERPRLVVADFMMINGKNGNKEKAETRVFKDAFGVERLYFPLVGNLYVPGDAPEGAMLETSSDHYIMTSDETDQFWWVALAFEDECHPIKHICFLTSDENKDHGSRYTLRGNRADHDMNWPDIDDHYVGLDFLDEGDDPSLAITGVGLTRKGNNDSFYVIASSPGTDMLKPYDVSAQQEQFLSYWGPETHYKAAKAPYEIGLLNSSRKDLDNGDKGDAWFGSNSAHNSGNLILPAFTTKALSDTLVFQKPRQFDKNEEDPDNYTN